MSLLSRALSGSDSRDLTSTLAAPQAWLREALSDGTTYSGRAVGVDNSLTLVPVYSVVSRLAGSIGSLPMIVYRRLDTGRERAENHRAWKMLHDTPNEAMAADELWELVAAHLLLWGNAFLAKVRDSNGMVAELWPLRPTRVQVGLDERGRYFVLDGKDRHDAQDILHIRGLGTDGLVGLSPVQQARQMLSASMELEEFSGRFWANNAHPAGVLTHPQQLSKEAAQNLKATWKRAHGGVGKAGEVAVLEEGMKWEATGMPLEDAQFLETAKFGDLRVCQLFGVPPYMFGVQTGNSMTYTNTEMEGIDFVRWSIRRWLVRIESSLLRDPSIFVQGNRFYPEFLVDALLRADTKTRFEAYKIAVDGGWMDTQEVRDRENLGPAPVASPAPAPTTPDPGETP